MTELFVHPDWVDSVRRIYPANMSMTHQEVQELLIQAYAEVPLDLAPREQGDWLARRCADLKREMAEKRGWKS